MGNVIAEHAFAEDRCSSASWAGDTPVRVHGFACRFRAFVIESDDGRHGGTDDLLAEGPKRTGGSNMNRCHAASACSVALSLAGGQASVAAPVEWPISSGGNGHAYELVERNPTDPISWFDARDDAIQRGGYLVTLTSQEEQDWVVSNVLSGIVNVGRFGPWIGLYQDFASPDFAEPGNGWTWVSGEPFVFAFWEIGEPNNDGNREHHAHLNAVTGQWNDLPAALPAGDNPPFAYIVEYGAPAGCGAADVAEPLGTLNIDDVLAFIGAFTLRLPGADLAPPSGVFNVDDVLQFLDAFALGCP